MPLCPHCRRTLNPDGNCRVCGGDRAPTVSRPRPPGAVDDAHARTMPSMDPPGADDAHARTLPSMNPHDPDGLVSVDLEAEPPPLADQPEGGERPADDPLLGRLVADKFLVQRLVGTGGVGRVYRAIQQGLQRPVALKLLHHSGAIDRQTRERFHREARAASRLNHPGVAAVYDFGQWEGELYIALEFIEGESLYDTFIRDFPLAPERLVGLMVQVCDALAAAHARGIVHRDLKPENIMVIRGPEGQEQVKVVDFGLAILVGPEAEQRLTREGIISGTPAYMSPEQVKGGEMDARTDLYSLGVILYEQLCAQLPFSAEVVTELVVKHLFADPEPPSAKNPRLQIHPALEALALEALAKDPGARPATAMDFRQRLLTAGEQIRAGQAHDLSPSRKATLGAGDREARAQAMGIPRASLSTPRETSLPWVLVIEPGPAGSNHAGPYRGAAAPSEAMSSLTVTLRANDIHASGPGTLDDLQARDEVPAYDAVVLDLGPDPSAVLDHLTPHLEQGTLASVPVVVVGPPDMDVMSRALSLGLADYVPVTDIVRKLPKTLRRLRRRQRR